MDKKEERLNIIIEAAINEFLEKGYEKASMESIAKAANLSKGGLYHHFSRKIDILLAVNLQILGPIQEIISRIVGNPSIRDGLKQFIEEYIHYWDTHRREITLYFFTMNVSFGDPQIMGYYKKFARQEFDFFGSLFSKGMEEGVFKPRNARAHAAALISCIDGYLAYMLIDETLSINDTITEIQKTFIDDLLINKQ
jgi:AcrR family transcriptional regulator